MGGGTFGVDAAARVLFRQDGAGPEPRRSAPCSPACSRRRPNTRRTSTCRPRAPAPTRCSTNMVQAGFMTEGQVFGARRNPATSSTAATTSSPNYFLDWAFDEMKKLVGTFPKSMTERVFLARTTLDMRPAARGRDRGREFARASTASDYHVSQAAAVRGRSRRRGARHGRRPRLRRQPVQPRHQRAAPARLLVQALCLCRRAEERLQRRTRSWSTGRSASATGGRTITGRLCRLDDADHGADALDQHHRGALSISIGKGNPKAGRAKIIADGAAPWGSARRCPTRRRCRSAPAR